MGNNSSKKELNIPASHYGGIFAKLEKSSFFPGETVTGQIYLNLQNPYPGSRLMVAFKGHEYATWVDIEYQNRGGRTYRTRVRRQQHQRIYKDETVLYSWGNGSAIQPGQYIFPFQFMIPPKLPGSFHFLQNEDSVAAEIKYTMTVYLMPDNVDTIAKVKSKTGLVIREMPRTTIHTQELSVSKDVKCCCCCSKGNMTIKTKSDKNAYAPTEEIRLESEIDTSQCKTSVEKVKAYFLQRITLVAGKRQKVIELRVHKTDFGAISGARKQNNNITFQLPPGEEPTVIDYSNPDNIQKVASNTAVISPTTNGVLVKSQFFLNVTCQTGCCVSTPSSELPIFIYAPVFTRMPDPIPPPNWAPQQIAPVNLVFPPGFYPGYFPTVPLTDPNSYGNPNQPLQTEMVPFNQPYQNEMVNKL